MNKLHTTYKGRFIAKAVTDFTFAEKSTYLQDVLGYSESDCTAMDMSTINEIVRNNFKEFLEYTI